MSNFEKAIILITSTVAMCILIAVLVLTSLTAMQVYSLQQQHQRYPRITHDKHGNMEVEIPEGFIDEPPAPKYKNPLGNKE